MSSHGKSDNVKMTTKPVTTPRTDQNAAERWLAVGSGVAKN
jgi:hypothetical protein